MLNFGEREPSHPDISSPQPVWSLLIERPPERTPPVCFALVLVEVDTVQAERLKA